MPTFVIEIRKVAELETKLAKQLEDHKEELKEEGRQVVNFDLDKIIEEVRSFTPTFVQNLTRWKNQVERENTPPEIAGLGTDIKEDIYGNKFSLPYDYAEITYDNIAFIKKIRLLGVDGVSKKRYLLQGINNDTIMENPFSSTCLRLIQNIVEITKNPKELAAQEFLQCKREAWVKDSKYLSGATYPKYRYTWDYLSSNFFSPRPIYDKGLTEQQLKAKIEEYEKKSLVATEDLIAQEKTIQENKEKALELAKKKKTKAPTPIDFWEETKNYWTKLGLSQGEIINRFADRFSFGCILQEAINCVKPGNISCRTLFENLEPTEIFKRLQLIYPKGSDTLKAIESAIKEQILGPTVAEIMNEIAEDDLQTKIRENEDYLTELQFQSRLGNNVQQEIENLEAKTEEYKQLLEDQYKSLDAALEAQQDVQLSERQKAEARRGGGSIEVLFGTWPQNENEAVGALTISQKIVAAIDIIIPIDDLCEAITSLISGIGLPDFSFPFEDAQINDVFAGFSFKINEAFLNLVTQALVTLLEGILKDLLNCDNLDKFVADLINKAPDDLDSLIKNSAEGLQNLYSQENMDQIIKDNTDAFLNRVSSQTNNIFSVGNASGSINFGIRGEDFRNLTINQEQKTPEELAQAAATAGLNSTSDFLSKLKSNTLSEAAANQARQNESQWVIDETKTRFVLSSGVKIVNLEAFDQYLTNKLRNLSSDGFSQRSIAEAGGEDTGLVEESSIEQSLSENVPSGDINIDSDKADKLSEDMSCIMRNITSLISPTQVLALLAGNATQTTLSVAAEIINTCSPDLLANLLPNNNAVDNFFGNFGNITGLSSLQDELEELKQIPEFNNLFPANRCGRYNSVEEFRQALMMRVVEPEEAMSVMEELRQERIDRVNEIGTQMIESINGNSVNGNDYDPSEFLADAIKHILNRENEKQQADRERKSSSTDVSRSIEDEIESTLEQSPVYQNMLNTTLDSIFLPIKQIFNEDMQGLIEAFSDTVEIEKPIERTITMEHMGKRQTMINPQFEDLLKNDLVPVLTTKNGVSDDDKYAKMVKKDSLKAFEVLPRDAIEWPAVGGLIADLGLAPFFSVIIDDEEKGLFVSGEPAKNYLEIGINGVPLRPVLKKENQKVVGDSLLKNINNFNISTGITERYLAISLQGYLKLPGEEFVEILGIPELSAFVENNKPLWNISFVESVERNNVVTNIFSMSSQGKLYTPGNGMEDFYIPTFGVSQKTQRSDSVFDLLQQKFNTQDITRKQSFDSLLFNKIKPFIYDRENENLINDFSTNSTELYNSLLEAFVSASFLGILNSHLLQKVSNAEVSFTKLEALQLTKECEHILDFDGLREEFDQIYNIVKKIRTPRSFQQINGTSKRPSPLSSATLIIMSKMMIKIFCIDILVKAILGFDYYKYSKNIVENEFFTNLICEFIHTELNRIKQEDQDLPSVVYEAVKFYYKIKVERGEYEQIGKEERNEYRALNLNYPLEMKKIVQLEFSEVLRKMKKISNVEDKEDINDFIQFIFDPFPELKVHDYIGIQEYQREKIIEESDLNRRGFILQKYVVIPKVNEASQPAINNSDYFTSQKIEEINNYGVLDLQRAQALFSSIYRDLGDNIIIFDCDDSAAGGAANGLFVEPLKYGYRLVHASEKSSSGPQYEIKNEKYPYYTEICQYYKSGYIKEINSEYDLIIIANEELRVNRTEDIKSFIGRNIDNYYQSEFYEKLKTKLYNNLDVNILFNYSLPLKELSSIIIMHSKLANNNSKMKYLLETTKKVSSEIFEVLSNIGDSTVSSRRFRKMLEKQSEARENVGNPAGPLDFDAFKPFLRTPIQILKGLTSTSDPNVGITDKLAALAAGAGAATGQKIFLPYSLTSLALLPFPVFTPPPAGIIPPLTAYNITTPLFLPFFLLEPLLWDLPWFQNNNAQSLPGAIDCEDDTEE